ncbi:MAG: SH3 domain-containing protein [Patescibacteria group bacterium]|nr:SH3 domain-containing protein [Patescibacteria group bacterium]
MRFLLVLLIGLALAIPSLAEEPQFPYTAHVAADDVYVRSGPGQNYYPTEKLTAGEKVEIYRHDPGGWYAIRPTKESFSWISAHYLSPGENNLAVVNGENVAARIGSRFSDIKDVIQVRLQKAEVVEVLGAEMDESGATRWYKIAPPSGEFRWISGRYVDRQPTPVGLRESGGAAASPLTTSPASSAPESPAVSDGSLQAAGPPRIAPPRPDGPRVLGPEQFRNELEQIDLELSAMVVEEPTVWHFDRLQLHAEQLLREAQTAVERGRARVMVDKIARFADLKQRHQQVASLREQTDRATQRWAQLSPMQGAAAGVGTAAPNSAGARFDGTGQLIRVTSAKPGAPQFALLDEKGNPSVYVTPTPGLNLRYYVGQQVGVNGTAGFIPEQRARHIMASHVQPIVR